MANRVRRQSAAVRKEEILRTAVEEIGRRGFADGFLLAQLDAVDRRLGCRPS